MVALRKHCIICCFGSKVGNAILADSSCTAELAVDVGCCTHTPRGIVSCAKLCARRICRMLINTLSHWPSIFL